MRNERTERRRARAGPHGKKQQQQHIKRKLAVSVESQMVKQWLLEERYRFVVPLTPPVTAGKTHLESAPVSPCLSVVEAS
jgi:enterochelin esterase-like enzyme